MCLIFIWASGTFARPSIHCRKLEGTMALSCSVSAVLKPFVVMSHPDFACDVCLSSLRLVLLVLDAAAEAARALQSIRDICGATMYKRVCL